MSEFRINLKQARGELTTYQNIFHELGQIQDDLHKTMCSLDFSISHRERIRRRLEMQENALKEEERTMRQVEKSLREILQCYETTEKGLCGKSKMPLEILFDLIDPIVGPRQDPFFPPLPSILQYLLSGIPFGNNSPSFGCPPASGNGINWNWLGYEFSGDHPGITAWLGKAGAEVKNELGYASVSAYVGKAKAETKSDFSLMEVTKKREYKDGQWKEKECVEFISAELGASAGVSALEAEAEAGLGNDMLGVEAKAEGAVGTAKAEGKGVISVGNGGLNANIQGKAMVAAAEGKASGTINILGIEITGKVGGYAGALGAAGKLGIEDNKFVAEAGFAALLGISGGIEIGFNEEGWNNFIDFITFWD